MKISEFFTKIKTLWDELDSLNPLPICSCDAANTCSCEIAKKCHKMLQTNRVISFLMRLDKNFGQVRSNMLMMTELPTSAKAYRILLQEETHFDISSIEASVTIACRRTKENTKKRSLTRAAQNMEKPRNNNFFVITVRSVVIPKIGVGKLLDTLQI